MLVSSSGTLNNLHQDLLSCGSLCPRTVLRRVPCRYTCGFQSDELIPIGRLEFCEGASGTITRDNDYFGLGHQVVQEVKLRTVLILHRYSNLMHCALLFPLS